MEFIKKTLLSVIPAIFCGLKHFRCWLCDSQVKHKLYYWSAFPKKPYFWLYEDS